MELKKIVILVITYNRKEQLLKLVSLLVGSGYKNKKIIIYDNGSVNKVEEFLLDDSVTILRSNTNEGSAGGFYNGMKHIHENIDYDYLWTFDDDTYPTEITFIEDMLISLQKINNFGFVVPKSLDRNGEIASMNMPGRRKILELINKKNIKMNSNSIQKVDYGSFNCIVFSKDAIAKCGYPNRDFFLRYDDVEYSSRISKEFNCFYLPNFVFIHDVLNSEVSQGLAYDDKRNYGLRNRVYASVYNESFPYNTYKFSIFLLMDIKKIMSDSNKFSNFKSAVKMYYLGLTKQLGKLP